MALSIGGALPKGALRARFRAIHVNELTHFDFSSDDLLLIRSGAIAWNSANTKTVAHAIARARLALL